MGSLKVKNGEILKADGAWPICNNNFEHKITNLHHIKALNSVFHPLFDWVILFVGLLFLLAMKTEGFLRMDAEPGYDNSKQS